MALKQKKETSLQPNWSCDGIYYLLLVKHFDCTAKQIPTCCPGDWKLIYARSRFTAPAESCYSPTEGEALALMWSLKHSSMFTQRCTNLIISVDHKSLLGIFNN